MNVLLLFRVDELTPSLHQPLDEFSVGEKIRIASVVSSAHRLLFIHSMFQSLLTQTEIQNGLCLSHSTVWTSCLEIGMQSMKMLLNPVTVVGYAFVLDVATVLRVMQLRLAVHVL